MIASNHVVTGALIVAVVPNHVLGLVLALLSHFVLDMIPHFGMDPTKHVRFFVTTLLIDMTLAASILLVLLVNHPANYGWLVAGSIIAASPDLLAIPFFIDILRHQKHKFGKVMVFLQWIQRSETIPGLAVDAVWFIATGSLLLAHLS